MNIRPSTAVLGAAVLATAPMMFACSSSGSTHTANQPNPGLARAQLLADQGNASALELIRQTKQPSAGCARPSLYATVDNRITGRALAADELAFFAQHMSLDQGRCGAFLYVFHSGQSTAGSGGYTAGAVIDDNRLLEIHVRGLSSAPFALYRYR